MGEILGRIGEELKPGRIDLSGAVGPPAPVPQELSGLLTGPGAAPTQTTGNIETPSRPTFMTSFLANLGPALAYGLAASGPRGEKNFATGLSGGLQGITQAQQMMFEHGISTAKAEAAAQTAEAAKIRSEALQIRAEAAQTIAGVKAEPSAMDQLTSDVITSLRQQGKPPEDILEFIKSAGKPDKSTPAKTVYDQGIPTAIVDSTGKTWDINDPKLPPELAPMKKSAIAAHAQWVQDQIKISSARGEAFGAGRPVFAWDAKLRKPVTVRAGDAEDDPARYTQTTPAQHFINTRVAAALNEVKNAVDRVDKLADNVKGGGITPNLIASSMADPQSSLGRQFQGLLATGQITKGARSLIFAVRNARQSMGAFRNALAQGGATNQQIDLLLRELPDETILSTGSPEIIRQQINSFRQNYESVASTYRLQIPAIGAAAPGAPAATPSETPSNGKKVIKVVL